MMNSALENKLRQNNAPLNIELNLKFLRSCQLDDGAIRWHGNDKLDPWDHTEAAMAFAIAGEKARAEKAYTWLRKNQRADGSWLAHYFVAEDPTKIETNFVAYPATGVWHHYLIFNDKTFIQAHFTMVERGIDFVLRHQHSEGDIQWATSEKQPLPKDALVTACSSILRSLECALNLAHSLGIKKPDWLESYHRLADALLNKPWRFDRTWESKSRYSMDWFYPILAGIYSRQEAQLRLKKRWHEFVEESLGCRCVSDEPWVTVAESCELVMATLAAGKQQEATQLFQWLAQWQDTDGGYWTGYSFRDKVIWPQEKTSWTSAAILLAADALYTLTPASKLFTTRSSFIDAVK
ncbi:prenyltransferase/squalene oxidase repeat-containing protein [Teredinibacter franksiae]|uniref:prenyltransferase/squalene oxidase repeat-containing protein n=1 Tax=Teredinibacter franksiae TaxID=2761453 RepID=UPI001FEA9623|nr:prenyltransferase/squalene oxidase repeat-containing protein [Teredinibacter franksiae]